MYKLYKFYPPEFNAAAYWEDRLAKQHVAGRTSDEFRQQTFWPRLQKELQPSGRYLEAGCGSGWLLFLRDEGFHAEGIDPSQRVLQSLTEYDRNIIVKQASLTSIPYANNSFDGVLSLGTIEQYEDNIPRTLQEMARVIKPGGFLFLEAPLLNWLRRFVYVPLKNMHNTLQRRQGRKASFAYYLFERAEIEQLLSQVGFEIVEINPHDLPDAKSHYGLYVDWPALRGAKPYQLNLGGRLVKTLTNAFSPWIAATGMTIIARKK